MGWVLVAIQAVLLLVVFAWPSSSPWTIGPALRAVGLGLELLGAVLVGVSALGLGSGLTAHPTPNGRAELRQRGIYALMRHPMYTGVMALSGGAAVVSGSPVRLAAATLLVVLFHVKSRVEERALARHFEGYADYARRTPRFVPRWPRRITPR